MSDASAIHAEEIGDSVAARRWRHHVFPVHRLVLGCHAALFCGRWSATRLRFAVVGMLYPVLLVVLTSGVSLLSLMV